MPAAAQSGIFVSAADILTGAMRAIGALGQGDTPTGQEEQDGWAVLNQLVDSWQTFVLTFLVQKREVFALVAGTSTYTIGPGGVFDTTRPLKIDGAGLIYQTANPTIEIPLAIITDDQYEALLVKGLISTLPTQLYYNATAPLGTVFLWPTPSAVNQLALYSGQLFEQFNGFTTQYDLPPAYARALRWNLAKELAPEYGRLETGFYPIIEKNAADTLALVKAANVKPSDLSIDPALAPIVPGGSYNILTDQGA
jgi:hypothetical protein